MLDRRYIAALWLLSGAPVGLALILLPPELRVWCFALFVLLETGHSLSPIALAWSHRGFRGLMLQRPIKYLLLPSAVFLTVIAIGAATSWGLTSYDFFLPKQKDRITDWTNPFPIMIWVYWAWNIYHFGMQHFGVARLLGCKSRYPLMGACLALTAFCMAVLPHITADPWVFFLMTGVISVNHWVVDIGLSSRVVKRGWLFAGGVLLAGVVGFSWMIPTSNGLMIAVVPVMLGARYGLGFVHFLYSRWVWRLSDPRVRAALAI